jgi:hypothetical protein
MKLDIFYKPPLIFVLDHLLQQLREGHPQLSHVGEGSPDLFSDSDAFRGGHGIYGIGTAENIAWCTGYSPAISSSCHRTVERRYSRTGERGAVQTR